MESIDSGSAGKNLSKLLKRVEAGESFELTRYGKVVALLGPPVGEGVLMKEVGEVGEVGELKVHQPIKADEVDDWGLPKTELDPPNPEPLKPMRKAEPEGKPQIKTMGDGPAAPEPQRVVDSMKPYVRPIGLSKSQQSKGNYDR